MAGIRSVGVLVAAALIGVAGGYGVGLATTPDSGAAASAAGSPSTQSSPSPVGAKRPLIDRTKPLQAGELSYRTREFVARRAVRSKVAVRVPKGWAFTQPEEDEGRFTDPLHKRWIRVEAGFLPQAAPADAMAARARELAGIDPSQALSIQSADSHTARHRDGTRLTYSTLVYSYIPADVVRLVMVRWISFGGSDASAVEMSSTGLPQDREALTAVLDEATQTVVRSDTKN